MQLLFCITTATLAQNAGDIASSAKYLDYDYAGDFHEGVVLVKKGNKLGYVKADGSFIVPYGDYLSGSDFKNGYAYIRDKQQTYIIINKLGREIARINKDGFFGGTIYEPGFIENYGAVYTMSGNKISFLPKKFTNLNAPGPKSVSRDNYSISVDMGLDNPALTQYQFTQNGSGSEPLLDRLFRNNRAMLHWQKNAEVKYGYVNRFANVVIEPKYVNASPFSEGLAAVSLLDEYGKEKWGLLTR
jgi:hypothetical protein